MSKPVYPLEQVLDVKKKRQDAAQKVVEEKKKALDKEEEELKKVQESRDKVHKLYQEKLTQLRQTLDSETDSVTIERMKSYLKIVQGNLVQEDAKVKAQQTRVDTANKALLEAQQALREKMKEVEKLQEHRAYWLKGEQRQEAIAFEKEMDELGTQTYFEKQKNQ